MTLGQAVARRIDYYLAEKGISLYRLCRDACLPVTTVKNLYTGHTKSPTLALVYKICDGLQVDVRDFLASEDFASDNVEWD